MLFVSLLIRRYPRHAQLLALAADLVLGWRYTSYAYVGMGAALTVLQAERIRDHYSKGNQPVPSLSALLSANSGDGRAVTVEWGDLKVNVTYDPTRLTGLLIQKVSDDQDPNAIAEALATLVIDWDVMDGAGKNAKPYPITEENLLALPMGLLVAMMVKFGQDMQPTGEAAGSFGAG